MTQEITRDEIAELLRRHGFIPDADLKAYAHGWTLNDSERIYLKVGNRLPLVLHPRHEDLRPVLLEIAGALSGSDHGGYSHNSNFTGFPKRMHTGKEPIAYGLDFGFRTSAAVEDFLRVLTARALWLPDADEDIARATDLPANETERNAVIAARRGQGLFRARLDEKWKGCVVTGCTTRALLRASHIKPWRQSTNEERLDPDNGLLLAAHLDAAFDQGLISFTDEGRILINSQRLPPDEMRRIGITADMKLRPESRVKATYLSQHRILHGYQKE